MRKTLNLQARTSWGHEYSYQVVPIQDALKKIKDFQGQKLDRFKKGYRSHLENYLLSDGSVVVTAEVDAIVYNSYQDFLASLQSSGTYIQKHIPTTFPRQQILYGLDGRKLVYYSLATEEAEIRQLGARPLPDSPDPAFLTVEGEVLVAFPDDPVLFQSPEDYRAYRQRIDKQNEAFKRNAREQHPDLAGPMLGRNPFGRNFPQHIEELAGRLPELLSAPPKVFDFSVKSLPRIDTYLYRQLITADFAERVFLPLLAYIGEVHRRHLGGSWVIRHDTYYEHWYPDVEEPDGTPKAMYFQLDRILDPTEDTWYPLKTVLHHKA